MSATDLFFHQPIGKFSSSRSFKLADYNFPKNSAFRLRFGRHKGLFSGGFLLFRDDSLASGAKTMSKSIKTSAYGNGNDGDKRIQALEQEPFVKSSSELRQQLFAGGFEATLNRLSKWLVSALFGCVVLLRHDGEALWSVIGAISNTMLSVALKRILNQERPTAMLRSDPGMPSSHAQSISYFAVFGVLSTFEWLGINEESFFISGFILACGSYLIWLRVSQKLHTTSQVVVGAILGSTFSLLCFSTWNTFLLKAFVSSLWVQISLLLAAAVFALGFALYVFRNWKEIY